MKIEIEHPFCEKYKAAYVVTNKEPRRSVILIGKDMSRRTISYARYLMSVHTGNEIDKNLEVDHVNDNKMDDRIDNFQLLTRYENIKKSQKKEEIIKRICPICQKEFDFAKRNLKFKPNPTCSRRCGGIKSIMTYKATRLPLVQVQ